MKYGISLRARARGGGDGSATESVLMLDVKSYLMTANMLPNLAGHTDPASSERLTQATHLLIH